MPTISVIILNYNGRAFLPACLQSLRAQTYRDFEVLVVDNGSSDGSVDLVRQQFPDVRVLALEHNAGFCGGNNRGMAATQGRYVVLLNNDTECHPDFLRALFEAIEAHPDAGTCASRMLKFADRARVDRCGVGLLLIGKAYAIGAGKPDGPPYNSPRYVFGACAGAALYRRALLDDVGAFDEDFFSHIEDNDLSWRAQLAGYRCYYTPEAIVYHVGGATSKQMPEEVLYRIQRNLLWTYLKNMPTVLLILLGPLHFLYSCYWWLRATRQRQGGIVWRAKVDALRAWPTLRAKRRAIQARRRLSVLGLLKMMEGWPS